MKNHMLLAVFVCILVYVDSAPWYPFGLQSPCNPYPMMAPCGRYPFSCPPRNCDRSPACNTVYKQAQEETNKPAISLSIASNWVMINNLQRQDYGNNPYRREDPAADTSLEIDEDGDYDNGASYQVGETYIDGDDSGDAHNSGDSYDDGESYDEGLYIDDVSTYYQ